MDKKIDSYLVLPVTPKAVFSIKMLYQFTLKVLPFVIFLSIATTTALAARYASLVLFFAHLSYFLFLGVISIVLAYGIVFTVTKKLLAKRFATQVFLAMKFL